MKSQKDRILQHLKKGKKITPLQALKLCGSLNLRARIQEIQEMGYNVSKKWKQVGKKRVLQYWMKSNVQVFLYK